jgi:voltage-gated potassium channel
MHAERLELLARIEAILDPPMVVLGLVFLVLVALSLFQAPMTPSERSAVERADDVIYWIFVADFLLRLLITPARLPWVRANWALVLSLALPFLRPLHAFHALAALQVMNVGQLVVGLNRALRALQQIFRGRSALYLSLLTLLTIVVGAGVTLVLERGAAGSALTTFGQALWWSATLVTTVNSGLDPVTAWGRVVGWLLRVYAVGVFGYLTASIASFLVGQVDPATWRAGSPSARSNAANEAQSAVQTSGGPPGDR